MKIQTSDGGSIKARLTENLSPLLKLMVTDNFGQSTTVVLDCADVRALHAVASAAAVAIYNDLDEDEITKIEDRHIERNS